MNYLQRDTDKQYSGHLLANRKKKMPVVYSTSELQWTIKSKTKQFILLLHKDDMKYLYTKTNTNNQKKMKMTIYNTCEQITDKLRSWLPPAKQHKMKQRRLSHHEGDRLLKIRFKLGHAARNLPMLIEHICKSK